MKTETIYKNKKQELKKLLMDNSTFEIENQSGLEQVVIWCKSFGTDWIICFQNGDMNGNYKGQGVWNNAGADSGIIELQEILEDRREFQYLKRNSDISLEYFVNEFISDYSRANNIDDYFNYGEE